MFCTLEEAAERLETTVVEIERMIDNVVLREFRDGPGRFVKTADIEAAAHPCTTAVRHARPAHLPSASRAHVDAVLRGDDILSPPADARPARADYRQRRPHRQPGAAQRRRDARPRRPQQAAPREPTAPCGQRLSLKQWLWMGLLDDRPHVLIVVLIFATAGACGLAGAIYLLTQWL
jgi:hypothetical protein